METYINTLYNQFWHASSQFELLKQALTPFVPGLAFAFGLYVVSKVLILVMWIVGKCLGRAKRFLGAILDDLMSWIYVIPSWYYGVSAVITDDTERVIDATDFQLYRYQNGQPCVKICLEGTTYWVNLHPFAAQHLTTKPGKEMAFMSSQLVNLKDTPKGCFAFMVNGQFVGCGFRAQFNGKYQMYTAYHVWNIIKGSANVTAHANGKKVDLFNTLRMSFGEEDIFDFVVLEDSSRISALGVKPLKTAAFAQGKAKTVGSTNGLLWSTAIGDVDRDETAFRFKHTSTTYPGWSGTPILHRESGAVIGIHTEAKGCGTANAGTALFSLLVAIHKKAGSLKLPRKESFEEYDVEWEHVEREEEFQTKVRFVSDTDKYTPPPMFISEDGYYWDDDESAEVDFDEPLFFPDPPVRMSAKENAPTPPKKEDEDFQSGLETQLKTPSFHNNSNTEKEITPAVSSTSSSSETTSGKKPRTLEQKKAKNARVKAARKSKKLLMASFGLSEQETERKEEESQKTQPQSMLSSQKPMDSNGHREAAPASLPPSGGMGQTSSKKENNRPSGTSDAPSKRQSRSSSAAWSFEEKITFLVTGQLRVETFRPTQEAAYVNLERQYQACPDALERALSEKVREDSYRKQMRSSQNNFKNLYRNFPTQEENPLL